jgi:hypothetical protein
MEGGKNLDFFSSRRGEIWYSFSQGSESVRHAQEEGMLGGSAGRGEDARWSSVKETGNKSFSYARVLRCL